MRFRKPELIPLLFIIGATLMLSSLGFWQVQRLQWKEGLFEHIARMQALPALGTLPQEFKGQEYRNVALVGTFLNDKTMHRVGGVQGEGPGFFIITPFKLEEDDRIILVNRGFSPKDKESKPEGMQTVKGIIRPLRERTTLLADNNPDKNVWFYEDIPAMSEYTGLKLTPVMIEEVGTKQHGVYPYPSDGRVSLRNDHLNYAITWFSIALIGLVMFAFYHRIPETKA